MRIIRCFIILFLINTSAIAQKQRLISGNVKEVDTKVPMPFISVSLKKNFVGTTTNENGDFDFYIPEEANEDTLVFNSIGYKPEYVAVNSIEKPIQISLKLNSIQLKEVVIRPLSAADYIRLAMRMVKYNYPDKPFITEEYYRKKTLENKEIINFDEAIFRTYYPNYQDTVKNQHQLLLFQKAEEKQIAFMKAHREEEKRKKEKKNEKNKTKGKAPSKDQDAADIANSFGGPEMLLGLDVVKSKEDFLDTLQLKEFNFEFGASSSYQGKELIAINYKSKGKVDHARSEGKIFIDLNSYAIVSVTCFDEIVIPTLMRPVLFLMGFGIENPTLNRKIDYQEANGRWYPRNFQFDVSLKLTKKHMWSANEVSDFFIEGIFSVNKIKLNNISVIPIANRFDAKKKMQDQVHNDENITWEGLNIVKR